MTDADPPLPADPDALSALLDEARLAEAAGERSRERWLRRQASEGARLTGLLLDAAERRIAVTVRLAGGRSHRGDVAAVGRDVVALATAGGDVLVALAAVAVVLPDRALRAVPPGDDRRGPLGRTLADVLADHEPEARRVVVSCGLGEPLTGVLRAVGADVVTVALDGGGLAHVALAAVTEVVLPH